MRRASHLREPANIVLDKEAAELSQACLVDGRIELCAAGALQADGAIRASYSLANVPLALGNALATAELADPARRHAAGSRRNATHARRGSCSATS